MFNSKEAEDLLNSNHQVLAINVTYKVKPGQRKAFYDGVKAEGIIEGSRQEKGNAQYEYYFSAEKEDEILLVEVWINGAAQEAHLQSAHYQRLQGLKAKYVQEVVIFKCHPFL